MLTDYMVSCPHCQWSGSLLPATNRGAWKSAVPTVTIVCFQCPRCHEDWHAQVVGDDVKSLPAEEELVALSHA